MYRKDSSGGPNRLILVHGAMCDHTNWSQLTAFLVPTFSVCAVDLRGHGRSPGRAEDCSIEQWGADIVALARRLPGSRPIVVGHSLGARVAIEAGAQDPDLFSGLILVDASRSDSNPSRAPGWDTGLIPVATHIGKFDMMIGAYASEDIRESVKSSMSAANRALFPPLLKRLKGWDRMHSFQRLAVCAAKLPMLAIQSTYHFGDGRRWSLDETCRTTPYLDDLRNVAPQIETALIPRAGHFCMMEQPEGVAELIKHFANRFKAHSGSCGPGPIVD